MLTRTSILAAQALVHMAQQEAGTVFSPRGLGGALGQSQAYLAKVLRHLVKAGLLRSGRGSKGGVQMSRRPEEITLLAVVEACQGTIQADHCSPHREQTDVCAFHQAADDLRQAIVGVLGRWDVKQLASTARPSKGSGLGPQCLMSPRPRTPLVLLSSPAGARNRTRSKR